jgi:hypothetical protein
MSDTVYDLSKYSRHQEPNKPYWMPDPATEEDGQELTRYLDMENHLKEAIKEIPDEYRQKNAAFRLARIVPICIPAEGDHVCLIMQGMYGENRFSGGCYAVVCEPLGLDELHQDLNDAEREFRPEIEKLFEPLTGEGDA